MARCFACWERVVVCLVKQTARLAVLLQAVCAGVYLVLELWSRCALLAWHGMRVLLGKVVCAHILPACWGLNTQDQSWRSLFCFCPCVLPACQYVCLGLHGSLQGTRVHLYWQLRMSAALSMTTLLFVADALLVVAALARLCMYGARLLFLPHHVERSTLSSLFQGRQRDCVFGRWVAADK